MHALQLLAISLLQAAAGDACAALLPPALVNKLAAEQPGYRLPQSIDAGAQRVSNLGASGDWPCPFVVLGDFDGDDALDRAILLKHQDGGVRLIGVLNNRGQWQITLSEDWPLGLEDSELRLKEAGFYQREDAIKQPAEQFDQLGGLQAENSAFTAGKVNGLYAIYALVGGKWQKLTLRDQ